jgi:hypothetical protein
MSCIREAWVLKKYRNTFGKLQYLSTKENASLDTNWNQEAEKKREEGIELAQNITIWIRKSQLAMVDFMLTTITLPRQDE